MPVAAAFVIDACGLIYRIANEVRCRLTADWSSGVVLVSLEPCATLAHRIARRHSVGPGGLGRLGLRREGAAGSFKRVSP